MAGKFIDRSGPWLAAAFAVAIIVPMTVIYGFLVSPVLLMGLAMVEALVKELELQHVKQQWLSAQTREHATGQGLVAAASSIGAGIAALIAAPLYEYCCEITFIVAGLCSF